MNLIFVGPPGSGKGTQSSALAGRLAVPAISTGDMLREEVRRKTALGMQAKRHMDKGELIPDPVMIGALHERLGQPDCARGFILDGFPRTVAQAEALDRMLVDVGHPLQRVVSLSVPRAELIKRLAGRRTCRNCGAMYHIIYDPPTNAAHCNKCHGELYQRDDDHEDIVTSRLEVYERQTAPLLQYYRSRGLLLNVDGTGGREDVLTRILDGVGASAT